MSKTRIAIAGVMTAATLLGVAVGAQAQNALTRGQNRPVAADRQAAPRNFDPAARQAQMQARHAERSQALHDILAITPAQEGAWSAYQSAIKPPERGDRGGPGKRQEMENLTTPQRLDQMVEQANARHAEALARANATRAFYNQLSATQKVAFDALPEFGPGHGRRGGHGMGPGGRGPGGPGEGRGPGRPGPRGERPAGPAA